MRPTPPELKWLAEKRARKASELERMQDWGLAPQALGPAAKRGELFGLVVNRQRCYPREFLELDRRDVAHVTKALSGLSPEEMLVFWKRPHGALGGKTVGQLLSASREPTQLERITRLAKAWADEGLPGYRPDALTPA